MFLTCLHLPEYQSNSNHCTEEYRRFPESIKSPEVKGYRGALVVCPGLFLPEPQEIIIHVGHFRGAETAQMLAASDQMPSNQKGLYFWHVRDALRVDNEQKK